MIVLGVVLLIIGIVLLLAPIPFPNVDLVGWLLVLFGIVLVLVGVLVSSDLNLGNDHAARYWGVLAARYWG